MHLLEIIPVACAELAAGEELGEEARDGGFEGGQRGADDAHAGLGLRPDEGAVGGEGYVLCHGFGCDVEGDDAHDRGDADAGIVSHAPHACFGVR